MKKVRFMDTSFRDGFQSVFGARVLTEDFMPAVEAAAEAGVNHFEAGGGARFQALFFYCNESAFDMMDTFRKTVGAKAELQTLARGINVVALSQCPKDMIDLHARMFKKHGITIIRNFDALNDMQNLDYSGHCIKNAGLHHQICVTMMDLPPGCEGAHTVDFYMDRTKQILDSGIPYDSICFKDASGTSNPQKVYETLKAARKMLGDDTLIWFHTHDTAGVGVACYLAAIEGGATKDDNFGIDLAKSPVSGGTCQPDVLSMWHALKGKDWTIGIDVMKMLKAEEVFEKCMEDYFKPPEASKVSPTIPLSPMPGGALTANTMMMRDTNTLHLYPEVIKEMSHVVKMGGFGTSVTPVSQFYFQQAYANVTQGRWKKITDGYGNMILGYFGKTPVPPDPEVVKIAEEQMGKKVFQGNPLDLLEPATDKMKKQLQENNLEVNDENIFIAFACKEKGIEFLKGNMKTNIRKISQEETKPAAKASKTTQKAGNVAHYTVNVEGKAYNVSVQEGSGEIQSIQPQTPSKTAAPAGGHEIKAAMPGAVVKILVSVGDTVKPGDSILVIEAMKMENMVQSDKDGTIQAIEVSVGENVNTGDVLVVIS